MTQTEPLSPALSHADYSPEVHISRVIVRATVLGLCGLGTMFERGFYTHPLIKPIQALIELSQTPMSVSAVNRIFVWLFFAIYMIDFWFVVWRKRHGRGAERPELLTAVLTLGGAAAALMNVLGMFPGGWALFQLIATALLGSEIWRLNVGLSRKLRRPGLLLPLSFVTLIITGTILLKAPRASAPGMSLSWIDALFTITSAACVTGLSVVDTGTRFSALGQIIIALVIQAGGLGIIIFAAIAASLLGDRSSVSETLSLSSALNGQSINRLSRLVRMVVISTFVIELAGALLMYPLWIGDHTPVQRLGISLFHSISAFCNAGFALPSDSLVAYRYSPLTHLIIGPLIVLGGLGFPVLDNLWSVLITRIKRWIHPRSVREQHIRPPGDSRLTLHTKLVLTTTAGLYLYGTVLLFVGQLQPYLHEQIYGVTENRQTLPALNATGIGGIVADASFQSITARTAGFNSMPMDQVESGGRFILIQLMFIGGSPGGTAGGVKTITIAILLLAVVATLRSRPNAEAFGRRIDGSLIQGTATLFASLLAIISIATFLLCLVEPHPFITLLFEAVSAATTTGLSLREGTLTAFSKCVIIVTMFLGRIGPLALLVSLTFGRRPPRPYNYPREDVILG